jgi:hypothetical protein
MAEHELTKEEDWLVSDKACKGCKYYGTLSHSGGIRCCDYTYFTGRIRKNPPKSCEVKKKGPRPRGFQSTDGCVVHRKKVEIWHG